MNFKKLLSLAAATAIAAGSFAAMAVTASAAGVSDLTVISSNATFIAQDETTEGLIKDTLSWNGKLLTLNGNNGYSTSKGYSVFNGKQVQNLLQVKQGRNMAVKVSDACTIDVYHDDYSPSRIIQAGSTDKGTDYTVTQAVAINETTSKNYDIDTITVPAAGVVYIGASGDVYVAAIDIKFAGAAPIDDPVVETKYSISVADGIANGNVSINGGLTDAAAGTTVNVTATPNTGYVLDKITMNGNPIEGTSFTMPEGAVEVSATFVEYTAPTLKDLPLNTEITFGDGTKSTITEENIYADYLKIYATASSKVEIDNSTKIVNGVTYVSRIKTGGKSGEAAGVKYRQYEVKPAVAGTLQIIATSSNDSDARELTVGNTTKTVSTGNPVVYEFPVEAGETAITVNGGTNIYSIKLVETPKTTKKSYAFNKTISELGNSIRVIVNGTDNSASFTAESTIDKLTKFSGKGDLKLGIILNVPEGMTVTSVTIE